MQRALGCTGGWVRLAPLVRSLVSFLSWNAPVSLSLQGSLLLSRLEVAYASEQHLEISQRKEPWPHVHSYFPSRWPCRVTSLEETNRKTWNVRIRKMNGPSLIIFLRAFIYSLLILLPTSHWAIPSKEQKCDVVGDRAKTWAGFCHWLRTNWRLSVRASQLKLK